MNSIRWTEWEARATLREWTVEKLPWMSTMATKLCFVIGPIGNDASDVRIHADWLLEGIIDPVMANFPEFKVKRADKDPRPGLIDVQMIDDLLNAELVIADLSFLNPNAFYEIGIRHMAQKPIIHMQLATQEPPFDLSLYRAIKFSLTKHRDLGVAVAELKRAIESVLAPDYEVENPVTIENATSEQKVLFAELRSIQERLDNLEASDRGRMEPALLAWISTERDPANIAEG